MACVLGVSEFHGLCPWDLGIPWLVSLVSLDSMACVLGVWTLREESMWGIAVFICVLSAG